MIDFEPYIERIKKALNVPSSYQPKVFDLAREKYVRFQLTLNEMPHLAEIGQYVIHPASLIFDCSFYVPYDSDASTSLTAQVKCWNVNPERIARDFWNFSMTRYNVNRNLHLDVSQRKFFDRSDFRVEEYKIDMSEIDTKLSEILAKQYNILKQVFGLFFDKMIEGLFEQKAQYDKEIAKIENKIEGIKSKTMEIIKKNTEFLEEF